MAGTHLLLCLILSMITPVFHQQELLRNNFVSEEGRSITVLCPPYSGSYTPKTYTKREWVWGENLPRPTTTIYSQESGGPVEDPGARPGMQLNLTDWSLTIDSLQVEDTGQIYCWVYTKVEGLAVYTYLTVYNRWVDVRFNTSLTLECPVATAEYTYREWSNWLSTGNLFYSQNTSAVTEGPLAHDGMLLNKDTFQLTIERVRQETYIFTCRVVSQRTTNVGTIFAAIYNVVMEAEERTSVTLPCNEVNERTNQRREHYTRTWQRVNGDVLYRQYFYFDVFYDRDAKARADISLNNATFALTIARAQLEDNTMFVCTFESQVASYVGSVKLIIYINPEIILTFEESPLNGSTVMTVSCTIERVYPELGPNDFQMRWGTQTITSTGSQNKDKSYRYTVEYMQTVRGEDHGTVVECFVNPKKGRSDSIATTIVVSDQDQSPPFSLALLCGAAAAAVVIIVIMIVISACVCRRRKARDKKQDDQTTEISRAGQGHELGVPDATSLPEADHHDYQDVALGTYVNVSDDGLYEEPIDAPVTLPHEKNAYEKLKVDANTRIDKWFKDRDIPKATAKKLKRQDIVILRHLQSMSREDMVEAGLSVGERNRITSALNEIGTFRF